MRGGGALRSCKVTVTSSIRLTFEMFFTGKQCERSHSGVLCPSSGEVSFPIIWPSGKFLEWKAS
jgi:hypothetical protein